MKTKFTAGFSMERLVYRTLFWSSLLASMSAGFFTKNYTILERVAIGVIAITSMTLVAIFDKSTRSARQIIFGIGTFISFLLLTIGHPNTYHYSVTIISFVLIILELLVIIKFRKKNKTSCEEFQS
jgi:hypothetical protein